ncbi:MAG: DinB family protein [Candidatus Delongbacteria bacterium]
MNAETLISQLEGQARLIRDLLLDTPPEAARWRPGAESWSLLEVTAHLLDEEREDFRLRLDLTLHQPDREWPPIDPQGWVHARAYQERELDAVLEAFLREREDSLAWLHGLREPDWGRAHAHPAGFSLRAGDLLAAWVAHDLLHVRQIARLQLQRLARDCAPYSPDYAGPLS